MGFSSFTASSRLRGKSYFKAEEIAMACTILEIVPDEATDYFFSTLNSATDENTLPQASKLEMLRKSHGLSIAQLQKQAGVSRNTIRHIEQHCLDRVKLRDAYRLCYYFDAEYTDIFN